MRGERRARSPVVENGNRRGRYFLFEDDFFLDEDFLDEDFLDEDFLDEDFLAEGLLDEDFFGGTLPSARRASESPMAIACFRLVTFLPDRPLFKVPRFRSCMVFFTFCEASLPYLAIAPPSHAGMPRRTRPRTETIMLLADLRPRA